MAAPSEIDVNYRNNMLRERTFIEEQTSKDNFLNKTAPLFPAILDQDLSENVEHAGDTNRTNVKQRIIYPRVITDSEYDDDDDDDDEDEDDRNRKRFLFIVVCGIAILALIGVGILLYYKFWKLTPIEIAQKKCKEYTILACSLQSSSNKGPNQVVGGNIVLNRKMFPHQVYLLTERSSGGYIMTGQCGGSLINENFVLTAAHCVDDVNPATMKVLVGSLNRNDRNETLWKAVKKFYIHPDSENTGADANPVADIALIELEEDVKFNSDIRPICLNTKLEKRYNSSIYATGWGTTQTGRTSDYLKMVEVRIDNEADKWCLLLRHQGFTPEKRELLEKTTICVAHFTGGGVHKGDSGGPLQVKLQSHCEYTWEQIGINAALLGNYSGDLTFQHFVKVEYFIPWIVSVAWP